MGLQVSAESHYRLWSYTAGTAQGHPEALNFVGYDAP